jgi:hypothetical protein
MHPSFVVIDRKYLTARSIYISGTVVTFWLLTNRMTPEQTGHLTSLFAVGSAFLQYAVENLHIECMRSWLAFEQGQTMPVKGNV